LDSVANDNYRVMVCIPAYNVGKTIGKIIQEARKFADEVVIYDDGSVDNTAEMARLTGATTVLRGHKNKGYGAAMKALFEIAKEKKPDVMVTLDADAQHNPAEIPVVIRPIREAGFNIVIGSRFINSEDTRRVPSYRRVGINVINKLTRRVSFDHITDAQSGFRAFDARAISKINISEQGFAALTEILMKAKDNDLSITEVPVSMNYDVADPHTHNPVSHGVSVVYSVIQFITIRHPLACYGLPGIILFIIASLFINEALNHFVEKSYVSVPLILLSATSAIIAIILLVTGIMLYTVKTLLKGTWKYDQ
jgi:glycosyltransferase involved in cell wall biosynthesis